MLTFELGAVLHGLWVDLDAAFSSAGEEEGRRASPYLYNGLVFRSWWQSSCFCTLIGGVYLILRSLLLFMLDLGRLQKRIAFLDLLDSQRAGCSQFGLQLLLWFNKIARFVSVSFFLVGVLISEGEECCFVFDVAIYGCGGSSS